MIYIDFLAMIKFSAQRSSITACRSHPRTLRHRGGSQAKGNDAAAGKIPAGTAKVTQKSPRLFLAIAVIHALIHALDQVPTQTLPT